MDIKELTIIIQFILTSGGLVGAFFKIKNKLEEIEKTKLSREDFLQFKSEFVKKADTAQVDSLERIMLTYIAENKELLRNIMEDIRELKGKFDRHLEKEAK